MTFTANNPDFLSSSTEVFYGSFFASDVTEGVYANSSINIDMVYACISSLYSVNPQCLTVLCTNTSTYDTYSDFVEQLSEEFYVVWLILDDEKVNKRRATAKMEGLSILLSHLDNGITILASDIDMYFLDNPFKAKFEDIGVTTRGYNYWAPINGGIWYITLSNEVRAWFYWHMSEIFRPTWKPYIALLTQRNHQRHGLDWTINQNFLICCYNNRQYLYNTYSVLLEDCGPRFNYCPAVDLLGLKKAQQQIREAIKNQSINTVHLKSNLKSMIEDKELFPLATFGD